MKNYKSLLMAVALYLNLGATWAQNFSANVLAPLVVGEIHNPEASNLEWENFEKELIKMKELGVNSIATHIWWGAVELEDNKFTWNYYKKISHLIKKSALKWVPIFSFHQCGNKEETSKCEIPLPNWIWTKYGNANDIKFKSSKGNYSNEFVSVWATDKIIEDYKELLNSFRENFIGDVGIISEMIVGLGPNGELRYPSNNLVDQDLKDSTRGSIQAYSQLAINSFQKFTKEKYQSIENLNSTWEVELLDFDQILPPDELTFFTNEKYKSNYGIDFYHWYNKSLIDHAELMLSTSIRVFNEEDSPFKNIAIGGKLPAIHQRMSKNSDRLSELNAGLIRASDDIWNNEKLGNGYEHIISTFKNTKELTQFENVILHFSCIEKGNIESNNIPISNAKDLVFEVSKVALAMGLTIKGQTSSDSNLGSNVAWDNMWNAIQNANYQGLTVSNMSKIAKNPLAYDFYKWIIENMND